MNKKRTASNKFRANIIRLNVIGFSDKKVIQRLIPYLIQVVDSTSNYFNSSSNYYVSTLVRKYVGDEDSIKIKTGFVS